MVAGVWAQDLQRIGDRDITGTARYMGLAGAMTAIGGDASAVGDNPAGLGVYHQLEASVTLSETLDYTRQQGESSVLQSRFMAPQASLILSLTANDEYNPMRTCNFMIGFNRVKNFSRTSKAIMDNPGLSVANAIAQKTNGLPESSLDIDNGWNNTDIGWLSLLGYGAYLINPVGNTTNWLADGSTFPVLTNEVRVEEYGYLDEFNIDWGANFLDKVYVGLGLSIRSLLYTKAMYLWEDYAFRSMNLYSYVCQNGIGVAGSVGVMYKPLNWLSIGASFHTPGYLKMSTQTHGEMTQLTRDNVQIDSTYLSSPTSAFSAGYTQPLRSTFGLAFTPSKHVTLSMEYDYRHWKGTDDIHTLKAGIEAMFCHVLYVEAGYAYESNFQDFDWIYDMNPTTTRTDVSFINPKYAHFAGFAFGYRGPLLNAQLGYQFRYQNTHLYGHELQSMPYHMESMTHQIVLTLAWKSRD